MIPIAAVPEIPLLGGRREEGGGRREGREEGGGRREGGEGEGVGKRMVRMMIGIMGKKK